MVNIDPQEIERARALARQGDSQAAMASLSQLIQRDAKNVEAWLAMAEVVEDPDRVAYCLKKVLALDPGNAAAQERLSLISSSTGGGESDRPPAKSEPIDLAARLQSQDPNLENGERETQTPDEGPSLAASPTIEEPFDDAVPVVDLEAEPRPEAMPIEQDEPIRPDPVGAATIEGEDAAPDDEPMGPGPVGAAIIEGEDVAPDDEPMGPGLDAVATTEGEEAAPDAEEIAQDQQEVKQFNRTDLILVGLTVIAGIVLCGLIGAAVVSNSSLFSLQAEESPDEIVQVVFDNIVAANREDVAAYMATIHPDSPGYNSTQTTIQDAFTNYELSYEIFIPEMLDQGRNKAVISFVLTTRRIRGPGFRDNTVSGEMTLRKHEGEWKIYDQTVDDVQYLN